MTTRRVTLVHVLLCVALGVLSTIATAWLSAGLVNPAFRHAEFSHAPRSDGGSDVIVSQRGLGHTRINSARCAQLSLDASGNILMAAWSPDGDPDSRTLAGWPFRALQCSNPDDVSLLMGASGMRVQGANPGSSLRGGWLLQPFTGGMFATTWRALPLQPIWPGLFANVIVHAAMWFALLFGFGILRRRLRRRAGRCERCGYDLRSSGLAHDCCPECGEMSVAPLTSASP